jgi:DNA-binding transcriptional MerR regulator/effector-binding domain-containing protein
LPKAGGREIAMKKKISITELAKLRNTTTETLRHYDRIGLLKPEHVDPDTGYRYYSKRQVEQFDTIMDLKTLELSLAEIKEFMEQRDIEYSYTILKKRDEKLKEELEEKNRLHHLLQQKLAYIEASRKIDFTDTKDWQIRNYPKRKLVVSDVESDGIGDFFYEFTRLRSNIDEKHIVFGTDNFGSLIRRDSFMDEDTVRLIRFPAVPLEICGKKISHGKIIEIPEGKYLCCYGKGVVQAGEDIIRRVKKYLDDNGLEACGDIFERELIDTSMTNRTEEISYRLEVPVAQKNN